MTKDHVIRMRLNKEEMDQLVAMAKERGLPMSTFMRVLLRDYIDKNKPNLLQNEKK